MRQCNNCKTEMMDGFSYMEGVEYYCSIDCLRRTFTAKEHNTLINEGCLYYTDWLDD